MIDVARDAEGVRKALEEIFEEDFVRARIDRESAGATPETKERMQRQIPRRTLSPGYYRVAEYLLAIDAERRAGIVFSLRDLCCWEVDGLVALDRARGAYESRHPACSACGARQDTRFNRECSNCGVKFRTRKK
ncbi:hypothetical protein H7849_11940 [Alloacidobacterium dinghuense]|uniref:Uncharacterized protein n=1 Tax=Alloacidobacterium dinghuense TaxID=2763107 RepID=A0A7G8BPR7_9BACT|nr:hypothetical protein [Alloacidobacterium dinghuense]QNI34537.1 hypothetical protein H7849_11940 [Alloacidobacterium dinghuense]